jgi:GntR family transcriptional regulator/MocR family aminotransferase
MAGGVPDVRLVPRVLLARALRRTLTLPSAPQALAYGDPRGDARLRAALADLVRETRAIPAQLDDVLVTRGSQMALALVARAVVPRGGVIAVEAIGYPPAWSAFRDAGARVVPVPVDRQGLDVRRLEVLASATALGAVYVTPHHQYPTTATLSPGRRIALLELARRHRFAIIEDDYDNELHYAGRPVLPLASADAHGSVVYVGTLSKVLAPGLRLGFVVAAPPVLERIARERFILDRQGDHVGERAAAELLEDGSLARHVRRMRRIYLGRRDDLVVLLGRTFGERLDVLVPPGGTALWARVRLPPAAVAAWERRALAQGVAFMAGGRFSFHGRGLPFARLGFASLDSHELREAVRRLGRAFPEDLCAERRTTSRASSGALE